MKKLIIITVLLSAFFVLAYQYRPVKQITNAVIAPTNYINKQGMTVKDRVVVPKGYKRLGYRTGSFQEYINNYKLKPYGAKVINYDGSLYFNQIGHYGVLEVPVPKKGLQQCADALMRLRSEYLWDTNQKDKIGFNFTSGHYCSWKRYAEGYRPKIKGNKVTFYKIANADSSKKNFYKYLTLIYTFAGTKSLYAELPKINDANQLQIGDMLILGGSPGHVVMIGDVIVNDKGEKRYLLFQGNTPAQSVHLLKNLEDTSMSPWYKLELNTEVAVPGYTFYDAKFVRFK